MLESEDNVFEGNVTCLTKQEVSLKLSCGLIQTREEFCKFGLMDNFEAVTIKLKPLYWADDAKFRSRLYHYCSYNGINYYLIPEVGKETKLNLHYHGLMGFASDKKRKCFVSWLNKNFGKFYCSRKTDINNWYIYVHKGINNQILYLFDPIYELMEINN